MEDMSKTDIRSLVRRSYGEIAADNAEGGDCCQDSLRIKSSAQEISRGIGYSDIEILNAPADANMGLGCGNPQLIAELQADETVIDLGSGGGFDCFLAAEKVGPRGYVIGIDMTPEMVSRARLLSKKHEFRNVDFRLGEIENLPVADNTADKFIS